MKRIVSIALVIGLVMAAAPFASAQGPAVTGKAGEDRALAIQISGELDLQMRYINDVFMDGMFGNRFAGFGNYGSAWGGSPKLTLDVAATLAEKMSVLAELEVPRVDAGIPSNAFGWPNFLPGTGGVDLGIRQLYIKMDQVVTPDLALTFGIQKLVYDVRGNNNPLLLALGRSESAFAAGGAPGLSAFDETAAGGLRADYRLGDAGSISVFHMIVAAGPSVQSNELCTGVDALYTIKLDDKQLINLGALLTLINGPVTGDEVWLFGLSGATNNAFVDGLKIYAELGLNFGTYSDLGGAAPKVKANGLMFDIGAGYQLDMAWKPTFGVEYLFVSGTDPAKPKEHKGFVSYEDNNDLVVLEDKEFGFDIDENYSVIKIRAAVSGDLLASPVKDAFTAEIVLGIAKLVEDVGNEDKLGTEVDVKLSWMATKQLKVFGGIGALFGSDVLDVMGSDSKTAVTFFLGTNVKF